MKKKQKSIKDKIISKAKLKDPKTKSILIRLSEAKYKSFEKECKKHNVGKQKVIEELIEGFIDGTL